MNWILLSGALITLFGQSFQYKGIALLDLRREEYRRDALDLWQNIIEKPNLTEDAKLNRILDIHEKFTDIIENPESELYFMEKMYEWHQIKNKLRIINAMFENFRQYLIENLNKLNKTPNFDLAEEILSPKQDMLRELEDISDIMYIHGLFYKTSMSAGAHVCETSQSAQQVLFQLYNAVGITELKGYAMMQFSWMLLRTYGKGNYSKEAQLLQDRFLSRTKNTQKIVRRIMETSDRTVRRCDPLGTKHKEGVTYEQLTRLLQGYIENEVDMNNDNTCRENCGHYQYTENFGCYKDLYCSQQPKCNGKLLKCEYVDSDMWICPSERDSLRRYEFIEYENGRVLGRRGTCTRGTTKVDSWWRWIFWHCSYCFCYCDEQGPKSDRYFNLREYVSNVHENMVITGLRFRKHNQVMHLQIQEGVMNPRGLINETTLQWVPVKNYTIRDSGVRNGIDYHTMTWDKRSIDLDELKGDASHVVTGIRFRLVGSHLNLEVRFTEADFEEGKLVDIDKSTWRSNDNTGNSAERRTEIKLKKPDIPIKINSDSRVLSEGNQYIDFTHTDMDFDAAQTTVPFLDAQDVVPVPAIALSGVGLYFKGQDLSGGYVAPKLITYDFSPHIRMPEPDRKI